MPLLGPPSRGNDPLHVLLMAAALVVAAMLGAAMGFLLDLGSHGTSEAAPASQPTEQAS